MAENNKKKKSHKKKKDEMQNKTAREILVLWFHGWKGTMGYAFMQCMLKQIMTMIKIKNEKDTSCRNSITLCFLYLNIDDKGYGGEEDGGLWFVIRRFDERM